MKRYSPRVLFLLPLLAASFAYGASEIKDDAHFFSAETVKSVTESLRGLEQKYKHSIVIETVPEIPADKRDQYSEANKNRFFADLVKERARQNKVDGLYVLICRNPSHLQVGAGRALHQMGFTNEDRDKVRDVLVSAFKRKQYDEGLRDSVATLSSILDERARTFSTSAGNQARRSETAAPGSSPRPGFRPLPPTASTPRPTQTGSSWSWWTWAIILLGGYMLLRFVLRMFQRPAYQGGPGPGQGGYGGGPYNQGPGPGPGGYGQPGGGGGGGFLSGMLGGLLGGAAGNWAGNRWFGGGSEGRRPDGNYPHEPGQAPEVGMDDTSGGDFGPADSGDVGGGGDFGGGSDAGGGGADSGGGDF